MGKGDIKSAKGKRFAGSYGKKRQKSWSLPNPKRMAALKGNSSTEEEIVETPAPKKAPAKKPAVKKATKTAAKKTTTTAKKEAATKKPAAKKAAPAKKAATKKPAAKKED